ncbi:hypothetical protein FGB62_142g075 [Gracilaria domingensis]|nr:hypothetical protein FGB62_142g075 [Gracilaria domingensis]
MSTFVPPFSCGKHSTASRTQTKFSSSFTTRSALLKKRECARLYRPETTTRHLPPCIPVCFNNGPEDGDDYDDEDDLQVTLRDPVTRRSITVGIEESFNFEGISHILCYPIDDPVAVVQNFHDGKLHPVLEDELIAELYPSAKAVCAEHEIELKNTAYIMTAEDESEHAGQEDEDEDEDDEDEDEDDDTSVEVIGEFSYKGKDYMVIRPMQTVWLVAKEDNGTYKPIRDEQLEQVRPTIEAILAERDLSQ